MPVTTKTDRHVVNRVRDYIDPRRERFRGSDEIRQALESEDMRIYLQTWVYPMLDFLLEGEQWRGQAEYFRRNG